MNWRIGTIAVGLSLAVGSILVIAAESSKQSTCNKIPSCVNSTSGTPVHCDSTKIASCKKDSSVHCVAKPIAVPEKKILFFMNPNGRPCQSQVTILNGMKDALASIATVKYIKTTVDADQKLFYDYGIRGLPSLVIIDKNGKEIKRFTPGIQDESTILAALK